METIYGIESETVRVARELYSVGGWTAKRFAAAQDHLRAVYRMNKATVSQNVHWMHQNFKVRTEIWPNSVVAYQGLI